MHASEMGTGQVAKLLGVAPRTVSKWFDSGELHGHKLPVSGTRRVYRASLIRFIVENGMDLGIKEFQAEIAAYKAMHPVVGSQGFEAIDVMNPDPESIRKLNAWATWADAELSRLRRRLESK